jgi:hypothetical protein
LGDFISHYEPAFYSLESLSVQHKGRRKREISNGAAIPDLVFNFTAHNR